MNLLIAASAGIGAGLGLLLIAAGLKGQRVLPGPRRFVPAASTASAVAWCAAAAITAVVVYALVGWPVAALLAAGAVIWLPRPLAARAGRDVALARTEAIATWAEMIRDNMAGSAGLEQALVASAGVAPAAIAPELRRFAARVERMPLLDALGRLGTDLDHPSADLVVVALADAARMEARELGPLLGRLAETIRADVRMRLRVEVGRTRIRTSARIVAATTIVTIGFLFVFSRQLLTAYDTPTGQLWLLVVAAVFAAGGWLLSTYGQVEMPERFSARTHRAGEHQ
ncbi:MAG: pilus assembly protein TadB [Actinomycetota bacterium]|nr:pilus assembly protein TadB [Actinomycetota bacterium]